MVDRRGWVHLVPTALQAIAGPQSVAVVGVRDTNDRPSRPHLVAPSRAAHYVVYRIARHAGTMTMDVYRAAAGEIGELPYVELCAIVSTVAAVAHFRLQHRRSRAAVAGARRR